MKHCLIVDDSNSIRKVASRIMGNLSLRTSEAETAAEAIEVCRTGMPDCIVVDWQIPGEDSLRLVSDLRKLPGGDKAAILYLTSANDAAAVDQAMKSGASGHMMKPFDADSTARALGRAGIIQPRA